MSRTTEAAGGRARGAAGTGRAGAEADRVGSTEGLAVGGVGWCRSIGAVGLTVRVDRRRTACRRRRLAVGLLRRERQAGLARAGLSRRLHRLALGRRRPLAGHVVRLSHASLLPQPRTARTDRRQDAGRAVTVTALFACLPRRIASGHGLLLAGERRPAEDSCRVVHTGLWLAEGRAVDEAGSAVVALGIESAPYRRRPLIACRDGMSAARRAHRPLWTSSRWWQRSGCVRPSRGLETRSIRRRPRRRASRGVHSGLSRRPIRLVALEVRQPLVVGQRPLAPRRPVRRPPAHGLGHVVRPPLAGVVALVGLRRHIRTPRPVGLRAAQGVGPGGRRPTGLRGIVLRVDRRPVDSEDEGLAAADVRGSDASVIQDDAVQPDELGSSAGRSLFASLTIRADSSGRPVGSAPRRHAADDGHSTRSAFSGSGRSAEPGRAASPARSVLWLASHAAPSAD